MKAAKQIIPFIFLLCLLIAIVPVRAQVSKPVNIRTRIILPDRPVRFDSLTHIISRQADVGFSINTSRIAPYQVLQLQPGEQTLETFLAQLSDKTGIRFKLIGNHIVLFDKKPVNAHKKNTVADTTVSAASGTTIADPPAAVSKQKQERLIPPGSKSSGNKSTPLKKSGIKKPSATSLATATKKSNTAQVINEEKIVANHMPVQPKRKYTSHTQAGFAVTAGNTSRLKRLATLLNDTGSLKKAVTKASIAKTIDSAASSEKASKQKIKKKHNGRLSYMVGGGFARSLELNNTLNKNRNGWEINMKVGKLVAPKLEVGVSVGYNKFSGDFFLDGSLADSIIERIAMIPVLAGLRYYPVEHLYLSFDAGYVFPGYKELYGNAAAVPAVGVSYPLQNGNKVDLGIRYTYMGPRYSTGNTGAISHSFLSARLSYGFGNNSYKKRSGKKEKQQKENNNSSLFYFVGAGLAITDGLANPSTTTFGPSPANNNKIGFELNGKLEKPLSRNFDIGLSAGYTRFFGKYYKIPSFSEDTVVNGFAFMPVLLGIKYCPLKPLYLSLEGGYMIKGSNGVFGVKVIVPSVGAVFSLKNNNKIDVGIRFTQLMPGAIILEASKLSRSDYNLFSFRTSYGFSNKRYQKRRPKKN